MTLFTYNHPVDLHWTLDRRLVFGCGYDQVYPDHFPNTPPLVGVLGLGPGAVSATTQLLGKGTGAVQNVLGHCLSDGNGGYLFLGDFVLPAQISWTPMKTTRRHHALGPAELLCNDEPTGIKGLEIIFDSGSSTYFSFKVYKAVLKQMQLPMDFFKSAGRGRNLLNLLMMSRDTVSLWH